MRIHHPQATIGIIVVVVVVVVTSATFASAFRAPIEINNRLLLPKEVDRRRDDTALFSTRERRPPAAVSELSRQMAEMRTQIASENEDANLIMQALRGRNINDDDEQVRGLEMKLIEFDDVDGVGDAASGLPYEYDPIALQKFFAKRPQLAVARVVQVLTTGGGAVQFRGRFFHGEVEDGSRLGGETGGGAQGYHHESRTLLHQAGAGERYRWVIRRLYSPFGSAMRPMDCHFNHSLLVCASSSLNILSSTTSTGALHPAGHP